MYLAGYIINHRKVKCDWDTVWQVISGVLILMENHAEKA